MSDAAGKAGQLEPYFREMSQLGLMSAEDEVRTAQEIARLRRELWTRILEYLPFTAPVLDVVAARTGADEPAEQGQRLREASRRLRDRVHRAHRAGFEAARADYVARIVAVDLDDDVSRELVADLTAVAAGREPRSLVLVASPRQDSRPFQTHVADVRAAAGALERPRQTFVRANLRLVVAIARRYGRGQMPLQDRIQEGNLGLLKAVGRFDPDMGCRFSTYGSWWIRHSITRALADRSRDVRVPVHLIEAHHRLARASQALGARGGEPSVGELSSQTGMSIAKIERLRCLRLGPSLSLDAPARDGEGKLADVLPDTVDRGPYAALHEAAVGGQVRAAFAGLRPMEADILRRRFGFDDERESTLQEIATTYSLSRERIRQIQEQALLKLRAAVDGGPA